ncbi:MAG: divergent polysaccharide deacetylase family protein, partial [Epsilonproteobacteria bacterium]|nr:divergent polysaccharide deacetylase family protein [Campylobacterota bacterium]
KAKYDITAAHEIEDKKALQPLERKQHPKHHKKYPKLAIIFDDVSFPSQVKEIKKLNLKVTMSFFPPTAIHPDTPKLAKREPFYMVHLPMEAIHFNKEEAFTLHVNDSQAIIDDRIKKIKELFPRVHYINNHTGSKFTSNKAAVERLVNVFDKYGIQFIDSRTTSKTKVKDVVQQHHHRYMARDVFLDHKGDIASIKKQIALAVKIAKKYGAAIAIGHPHKNTLQALKESKNLFKGVELVYVYQLY